MVWDSCFSEVSFPLISTSRANTLPARALYAVNGGFYDVNGNPVDAADYSQATQHAVMAASTARAGWNNNDGLVAQVTLQIAGQPSGSLNQSDFYSQLHISYAELVDYTVSEIPYDVV